MEKKSLYEPQVYQECAKRVQQLTEETAAHWGSMNSAQMLAHCSEILEVSNGKELKNTPFLAKLFKGYIRKMVVGEKPYGKGIKTHPQYLQRDPRDFQEQKSRLLSSLENFHTMDKQQATGIRHTMFGTMSLEERGWSAYKHLDHHLTQFGV